MATRISERNDSMVLNMMAGTKMSGAGKDTLLQNIKTHLDANFASFKNGDGNYTVPHVKTAALTLLNRGK